jgi:hypothetical protein
MYTSTQWAMMVGSLGLVFPPNFVALAILTMLADRGFSLLQSSNRCCSLDRRLLLLIELVDAILVMTVINLFFQQFDTEDMQETAAFALIIVAILAHKAWIVSLVFGSNAYGCLWLGVELACWIITPIFTGLNASTFGWYAMSFAIVLALLTAVLFVWMLAAWCYPVPEDTSASHEQGSLLASTTLGPCKQTGAYRRPRPSVLG